MTEAVTLCRCDCMENGRLREQKRIIDLLESKADEADFIYATFWELFELIKRDQK